MLKDCDVLDSPGVFGGKSAPDGSPVGVILPPWVLEPNRLWSLLDMMIEFNLQEVHQCLAEIRLEIRRLDLQSPDDPAFKDGHKRLEKILSRAYQKCYLILNEDLGNRIILFAASLEGHKFTSSVLSMLLVDILSSVEDDLSKARFLYIPKEKTKYLHNEELFGDVVHKAFPSARYDIKEAGTCFAADLFTATVFHLIRAAEIALRVLATELGVSFPDPLEYQEWSVLIDKIQTEANARCESLSGREAKTKAREFYNGAVGEFRAFKDAWRNHVMHTRFDYDEPMAQSIMNHVREFVQRLAAKGLREGRRTPLRW